MINILGINIATDSRQEILKKISAFLNPPSPSGRGGQGGEGHYIVTPNPEFLLAAKHDEEFFYILNQADIAVPDGIGLVFAGWFMGKSIKRFSGIDLMLAICKLAAKENKSVYLLGGGEGVARMAAEKLKLQYPNLKIAGAEEGLKPNSWKLRSGKWLKGKKENKKLMERINAAKPDIIFVAFGHPRQERWIYHSLFPAISQFNYFLPLPQMRRGTGGGEDLNLNVGNKITGYHLQKLGAVKLLMGVGGSFDFIAGRIKRAPKWMRTFGLEWLYRLWREPAKRWRRIWAAVMEFPLEFLKWRFIRPLLYRPNVACLLYRKVNLPAEALNASINRDGLLSAKAGDRIEILLAERNHPIGHWQLPQGGTDGEDLITAGTRELREEIGTRKFKPVACFKNLHKYKFGVAPSRGVKAKQIEGYKGQKQGLFIAEFIGSDNDITINFWDHRAWRWVDLNKVADEVHKYRREATKIFIDKFKSIL